MQEENRCNKCKHCYVESSKDVAGYDKGIPLYSNWYVCDKSGEATDPNRCRNCCEYEEKDKVKQQD